MAERWLVIDDSSTIQRVIKLAFQDYDVLITEADSCPEAAREIMRMAPTLVIADAAVTGVQSVQDFVNLRNHAAQTPFIIIEGSYDNIDENQFRGAGFIYFLRKPFDASQLLAVTRQALGRALPYRQQGPAAVPPPPPSSRPPRPLIDETQATPMRSLDLNAGGFDLGLHDLRGSQPNLQPQAQAQAALMTYAPRSEPRQAQPISFSLDDNDINEVSAARRDSSQRPGTHGMQNMLEPMLKEEMERLVKNTVEDYCRKNFAQIARELIARELERLTQERVRLLVDK